MLGLGGHRSIFRTVIVLLVGRTGDVRTAIVLLVGRTGDMRSSRHNTKVGRHCTLALGDNLVITSGEPTSFSVGNESLGCVLGHLNALRNTCGFHAARRVDSVTKQLRSRIDRAKGEVKTSA